MLEIKTNNSGNKALFDGEKKISDWYSSIGEYDRFDLAKVRSSKGERFGLINKNGERITEWYDTISDFTPDEYYKVSKFTEYGDIVKFDKTNYALLAKTGKRITDWYDGIDHFDNDGFAKVQNVTHSNTYRPDSINYALIDKSGKRITDYYASIGKFNQYDLSVVMKVTRKQDDTDIIKYGLINKKGELVSEWYESISAFSENGNASVRDGRNRTATIDNTGKRITDWS